MYYHTHANYHTAPIIIMVWRVKNHARAHSHYEVGLFLHEVAPKLYEVGLLFHVVALILVPAHILG